MFKRFLIHYQKSLIEKRANFILDELAKNNITILKWLEYTNVYFANIINYKKIYGLQERMANALLNANVITKDDEELEALDTIVKELESSLVRTPKKIMVNKSELRKVI